MSEQLSLVPTQQLLEILVAAKLELKRRKSRKKSRTFRETRAIIKSYEERYPELLRSDFDPNVMNAIPQAMLQDQVHTRLKFLKPPISQDWTFLFPDTDPTAKYYVYAHVNPNAKNINMPKQLGSGHFPIPFYIGKGSGPRAYDLTRNQGHGVKLRELSARGVKPNQIVRILKRDLTEAQAFALES